MSELKTSTGAGLFFFLGSIIFWIMAKGASAISRSSGERPSIQRYPSVVGCLPETIDCAPSHLSSICSTEPSESFTPV